ncbi:hemagglutinin repeat-containing protein [Paraburkholderia lycopersici]|uniref:Filamentous hemagglutinin n=1 Tax=Paraburkholderia lycopersici TaxID=416944 RepID=A0A1G6MWB1_9BURK|nr:hemagglutinin repeat-containing protein [Paraburkholderia lycopersici]SDC59812.1 filamentous hemagglutinin [Paraburkholderia lycopersici]
MNNRCYRLVFSKLRGMLVAVAETATTHGKDSQGETTGSSVYRGISLFAMRQVAFAALALFAFTPVLSGAQIVPSGTHAPNVISTANGVPQVNVQKPSGAGVSMNTYSQFDVQKNGAILNNSPVIVNTQLAGQINGNPTFGSNDAAKIIVNQVNSNNPSQLRGYVEVAGQRTAAVVVSNASGLIVDGGGFINTSRGVLTTGNALIDANGNLAGFDVTQGNITVQGEGFNASNIDQAALIARAVQVNAAIYGNTLNVVTGANNVDYSSLKATPVASSGAAAGVSIDVSQIGGMYANRIILVGTENGVGVANAGTLAAQDGDLTLTTAGQVMQSGRMQASGNVAISAGSVANSGTIYARQSTALASAGALTNSGTLAAQWDTSIRAGSVASNGLLGAGINSDDTLGTAGNLTVSSAGLLSATGHNVAASRVTLDGVSLDLSSARTRAGTALVLSATGGDLSLRRATTGAGSSITANAAGTLDNSGGTLSAPQLAIQAGNLTNRGGTITQTGTGATDIAAAGTLDNTGGLLQTNSAGLTLAPAALVNDGGRIAVSGTGKLSVSAGSLSNNGGTIATNGALAIQRGLISNRGGTLEAKSSATVQASSLDNSAGGHIAAQAVSIADTGAFNNAGGTVQAADTLGVAAQTIANDRGTIANAGTGVTTVTASGTLTNTAGGLIGGNGDTSVSGGRIDNRGGSLVAGGALSTRSGSTLDNTAGRIQASGDTSVAAQGAIANVGGRIGANGSLRVSGASLDNTSGRVANTGTRVTALDAGTITNSNAGGTAGAGVIGGNGDVVISGQSLSNTGGGQVVAGHDLSINESQAVDNSGGKLSGTNNLTLNGTGAALSNVNGSIHGDGTVSLHAASFDNTSGTIGNDRGSGGSVAVTTGALTNQNGAIGSDRNLTLTTNQLTGDGTIVAGQDGAVTVNGDYTYSAANRIQANHDLAFTVAGNLTNHGALAAVNALTVSAANVDNQAGGTLNSVSTTLNAAGAISNEGRIEGDAVITNSATLTNTATIIGNTVTLNASQSIANDGAAAIIAGASGVNLYSPGDISNTDGANVFSLGNVNIAADATRDANGLLANRANSVTNDQSTLQAQGNVEIAAQTLTNTRPAPDVETVATDVSTVYQTKRAKYIACATTNADGHSSCTQAVWDYGYKSPVNSTFSATQIVSETSGSNATDNVLVVNVAGVARTIYYNTLTKNGDGTVTVNYWDGYDPNINYVPDSEYVTRSDAHNGYQRVEIARNTTTTTQRDQVSGTSAQQGQLLAGGNMTLANVGTLNNAYSAIAAGGSIQIGSTRQDGTLDPSGSGNYGGTLVNNVGRTLYQYQQQDIVSTYAWNEDIGRDVGMVVQPSVVLSPVAIGGTGGTIIANNAVSITGTDINNTNVAAANSATGATGGTLGANQALVAQKADAPRTVADSNESLHITLPTNGLYSLHTAPNASYLVETDPRFTSYTKFISSDYMLGQLGLNPQNVEKRLGDALYEQQLVQNQITQLTGRVYLHGHDSALDEYTALMTAGVNVAQAFGLQVGVALSAAQMDALTSDIVWLVNQTVALPDGTTQNVLVPQVYLAHTHANDLQPTGALIAADDVALHATGSVTNMGTIQGGAQTALTGTNIVNRAGTIASSATDGTTVVSAVNDVVNASGLITGNRVAVLAGNDIVNATLVDSTGIRSAVGGGKVSQTLLGAQGTIASTGDMLVSAGNDLAVHGANIAAGGSASVGAGHDMTVDAVQSVTSQSLNQNANRHWEANGVTHETSAITAGGNLAMQSGNDMTLKGAQVMAGGDLAAAAGGNLTATTVTNTAKYDNVAADSRTRQQVDHTYDEQAVGTSFTAAGNATLGAVSADASKGNVTLTGSSLTAGMVGDVDTGAGAANIAATGNVTLNEAREEHDSYQAVQSRRGSFVSSTKTGTMQNTQSNIGVGSLVSGDTVNVQAGKDLTVQGSTVVGTNDVSLAAAGNVSITTSRDTQTRDSYYRQTHSGIGTSGLSVTIGTQSASETGQSSSVVNNASTVGSINGDLTISAGKDLHVTGSDLVAGGDVTGTAQNVIIDAATDSYHQTQNQQTRSSGLSIGLSGSIGDAINGAYQQGQAIGSSAGSSNDRAAALHAIAATGDAALAGYGVYQAAKSGLSSASAPSIGVQVSVGSSHSSSDFSENQTAEKGSTVMAGGTVALVASGNGTSGSGNVTVAGSDVSGTDVLLAAKNQVNLLNTTNTDSTRSSNASSGWSAGVSVGTNGVGVSASMQNAHGDGNSDAAIQNNTHVTGTSSVTVISGGDTSLIGSNVSGGKVTADVGGNLNVASVQDTTASAAHQSSAGGGFNASMAGGSASFSAQNGHGDGTYAQVNEQAGIYAGDGGFNVNVKGNTDLTGAVISSTAEAEKNTLATGTLTFSDIENHSHYSAASNGIGAGIGVGSTGKATGPGSVSGSGGITPMISQDENGDQSATTRSAVSAGTINVTNQAAQTQDVASLSRDTTNTNGTVSATPDVNAILNQQADTMQAAQAAGQVVAQGIGAYADKKEKDALAAAQKAYESGDLDAMGAALADYKNWKEGGDSRAELHAAGGALIGGLGGGSAFSTIGGAAGAGLSSKLAPQTKELSDAIAGATGSSLIGNLAGNVAAGLSGALIGGTAGAAMGSNVNLYNQGNNKDESALAQAAGDLVDLYNAARQTQQAVSDAISSGVNQFIGQMNADAQSMSSQRPSDLAAQGARNGLDAIVGMGGGKPPTASPGAVLVDGAGQALAGGTSSSASVAGYGAGNTTLNSGNGNGESGSSSLLDPQAETHVLYGDGPTSGGHLSGVGKPGKSEFPSTWTPQDITNAISDGYESEYAVVEAIRKRLCDRGGHS